MKYPPILLPRDRTKRSWLQLLAGACLVGYFGSTSTNSREEEARENWEVEAPDILSSVSVLCPALQAVTQGRGPQYLHSRR